VLIGGQVPGNGVGGQAKISGDGTRMTAGELNLDTGKVEANIYHIDAFQWQPLGSFGASCDAESSGGWNISGDGSTVVGLAWEPGCQAPAPDVRLALPLGMSPDGRNIVGRARTKNGDQAFILRLGPSEDQCPADLNHDGVVDAVDLTMLLTAWGTPDADLDGDGITDATDLVILLAAWGDCP